MDTNNAKTKTKTKVKVKVKVTVIANMIAISRGGTKYFTRY
jgi:hypothetical protein